MHNRRARSAFTMVELVIVVLVMSILAAAATPKFLDSLVFHRVEAAALRLKSDFELARHTARLTSTAQSITFTDKTYTVSGTEALDKAGEVYGVDLEATPYELDVVTPNFNSATSISFDGYGKPSSGGTIVLRGHTHKRTLTVDAATGEVTYTRQRVSLASIGQ